MRFLTAAVAVATLALVGSTCEAKTFQFDVTADNNFAVYVSKFADADTVIPVTANGDPNLLQTGWTTPSKYTGIELVEGDVISVYVQNDVGSTAGAPGYAGGNPSALVGRLREISNALVPNSFISGGYVINTDNTWKCAYRTEAQGQHVGFDVNLLTGNLDWARADYTFPPLTLTGGQQGSTQFTQAQQLSSLYDTSNIWWATSVDGNTGVQTATIPQIPNTAGLGTPYWIYGTSQLQSTSPLVHHGWCRYEYNTITPGGAPIGGAGGDPVFSGFQGQEFQFHGLPDEHFNLISSPQVQLNAHFVYLSSGKCDYNNTLCWTHPGTYMDVMGFSIGEARVKVVAGSHADGLRLWVNDVEVPRHSTIRSLSANVTASLHYTRSGHVKIQTDLIDYEVVNSDMFMNLQAALKSHELLTTGAHKHTVTDANICHANAETHNHQLIESTVSKKYPITTPLHGLVGQTWRNVKVCNRDWMGTVQDYVTESLFGTTYHYNYFNKAQ